MRGSATSCTCFFFNDTATTEIYTLSLHDALPIFPQRTKTSTSLSASSGKAKPSAEKPARSEEHTSELQSQSNLVCRLLLVKNNEPLISDIAAKTLAFRRPMLMFNRDSHSYGSSTP